MVPSGIPAFDTLVQGLRLGDNVVWQVDTLADYRFVVEPFIERSIADGRTCVYLRFASHPRILAARPGLDVREVDPRPGFDAFTAAVHRIIGDYGREAFYAFDNLSALVVEWATDELLANFFRVTCPYLFELDTVTYFALTRGHHAHHAVARIRDTTQLLVSIVHARGRRYVHALKVWDRYSPDMFLPHAVTENGWRPILSSGDAAAVHAITAQRPLGTETGDLAPWDTVVRKLQQYREAGDIDQTVDAAVARPEVRALKGQFTAMMLGTQPEYEALADRYVSLNDLFSIHSRLIGRGRVGGKAAGMLLARSILAREADVTTVLEPHDSFYVGSDVFFTFLVNNDLFRLRLQLMSDPGLTHEAFAEVEARFLAGTFPPAIVERFRSMLDYYGQAPIIVRSSSLLEDGFGNAFAGKYRSEFSANQGPPEARMTAFLRAVKLVYASALNPDVLAYRRRWGLVERDEQMAVLVQRVSGERYRHYFFPTLAGVALSHNLYVWADRIDPAKGVIRLVFGLGTRAVDRVGSDYPRMVSVSDPMLRPEVGTAIAKYAQRHVDAIDLKANAFTTVSFEELVGAADFRNLHMLISELRDGGVYDPVSRIAAVGPGERGRSASRPARRILTFSNLLRRTEFVPLMGRVLDVLERAYGRPVDLEFTASVGAGGQVRLNLLQCRPMTLPGVTAALDVPHDLPPESVLFRSSRLIGGGSVTGLRYIVYIVPNRYAGLLSTETRHAMRSVVGQINARLRAAGERLILIGPGRFGSSNTKLGVNVRYADIDNAAVLVELGRNTGDHNPEVSYGTHFFQDLVESRVLYFAVFPDARNVPMRFNRRFFDSAPNHLTDLVVNAEHFAPVIKVIDVPAASQGRTASVLADPQGRRGICYLS